MHGPIESPIRHAATPLPAGRVERLIGKPSREWSASDLVDVIMDEGIRTVSLMHVGADGWLKTLDFVPLSESHLKDVLAGGERADGSSLFAETGIRPGASDIVLRPRPSTAFIDPFSRHPTLALMCRHVGRDGKPLAESPDTILRRANDRVRHETGAELWALGEVEYFLGKKAMESDVYGAGERGYHAASPFVYGQNLRREAMSILGDIGLPVKYGHSEVGYIQATEMEGVIWEQHEIELALTPLPEAADAVVLTQWVLRNLAHAAGLRCSFDPIVREGHAGSGLHFHFSPVREGKHLPVFLTSGALSDEARWLIGGLALMGGALMAFGNRVEDSFTRLIQAKEAPSSVTWGLYNRQALIRIPIQAMTEEGRIVSPPTIEFRLPDGSAHPYLLLAGVAQALLQGREIPDLDAAIERTRAPYAAAHPGSATPVPHNFEQIAEAVALHKAALEKGNVFPEGMITKLFELLELKGRTQRPSAAAL
ncbi:MAG: glutamine synthetase beta-grasp domain-containing protein [Planctomycetota bacterium]